MYQNRINTRSEGKGVGYTEVEGGVVHLPAKLAPVQYPPTNSKGVAKLALGTLEIAEVKGGAYFSAGGALLIVIANILDGVHVKARLVAHLCEPLGGRPG